MSSFCPRLCQLPAVLIITHGCVTNQTTLKNLITCQGFVSCLGSAGWLSHAITFRCWPVLESSEDLTELDVKDVFFTHTSGTLTEMARLVFLFLHVASLLGRFLHSIFLPSSWSFCMVVKCSQNKHSKKSRWCYKTSYWLMFIRIHKAMQCQLCLIPLPDSRGGDYTRMYIETWFWWNHL